MCGRVGEEWDGNANVTNTSGTAAAEGNAVGTWRSATSTQTLAFAAVASAYTLTYAASVPRGLRYTLNNIATAPVTPIISGVGLTDRLHLLVLQMAEGARTMELVQSASASDLIVYLDFYSNLTYGVRLSNNGSAVATPNIIGNYALNRPAVVGFQYNRTLGRMLWVTPGVAQPVVVQTGLTGLRTGGVAYQLRFLVKFEPVILHELDIGAGVFTDAAVAARVAALRAKWNAL